MTKPLISVIIPAYKARNYLGESLASVAAQKHRPLEVLVIDDQSPEPIEDIVRDYRSVAGAPELRMIRHEKNAGLGAARNTGIREAKGEWIALLDHDDLWAPGHLESLLAAGSGGEWDLLFCTSMQFREDPSEVIATWGPAPGEMESNLAFNLLCRSFITPSATLIRRDLLQDLGGFNTDPRVHMCEDFDLWQRLIKAGGRIRHVEPPTCYYRKHPSAATERLGYMDYQKAYVTQLHAGRVKGCWVRRRSLVARRWWKAWLAYHRLGEWRWDVLASAVISGIVAPREIIRGITATIRTARSR